MGANYKAELVAVFGQPVAENPTGVMQEAGFAAAGLNWRYLTIEVPPEKLGEAVRAAKALGFQGFNLTIPHKVAVMEHLDEIADSARMIGAVNTVRREGDRWIGENTDGKGFLRGVRVDARVDPKGKSVLLLGAGGAARAIAAELALAGATLIEVWNRGAERGERMAEDLGSKVGEVVVFKPWHGTLKVPNDFDLLVNALRSGCIRTWMLCRMSIYRKQARACWCATRCSIQRRRGCYERRGSGACLYSTGCRCWCIRA